MAANANSGLPKRSEDDCDMATSIQASELTMYERMLLEAARRGKDKMIDQLLERGAVDVNCRNNLDRTALHMAVSQNQADAVNKLLDFKADLEISDKYGMTPLLCAAHFGHQNIVEILLAKGAVIKRKNKLGQSLLHIAAEKNNVGIIEDFLLRTKRLTLNDVEKNNRSALMIAASLGNVAAAECLLKKEEIRVDLLDTGKKSALHWAAENGSPEMLKLLLKTKLIEKINERDENERAPLHYVVELGHVGAMKVLLSSQADITLTAERGYNAFHLAATKSHILVLKELANYSSGTSISIVNAQTDQGDTALHIAALNDDASTIYCLVHLKTEIDLPNNRLQTPLHSAVEQNKPHAVEALLLCGAKLTEVDKTKKTPLILATQSSYICLVDMIIKADRYRERDKLRERLAQAEFKENTEGKGVFAPADYITNRFNINDETDNKSELEMEKEEISVELALKTGQIPTYRLMEFNQSYAEAFTLYLWKLAFHHLRNNEWKEMATHWHFKPEHIAAIDYQDTGESSYKQHGYRVLCIWFHGIGEETPVRELYDALTKIGRRTLAEKMRKKLSKGMNNIAQQQNNSGGCAVQ